MEMVDREMMRGYIKLLAMLGLLLLSMVPTSITRRMHAQGLPSLTDVLNVIPADAVSANIQAFTLTGQAYAAVQYSRIEPVDVRSSGTTIDAERGYLKVYRWDGMSWQLVLDGYQFAQDFYGSRHIGPLVSGNPTPQTALVSFHLKPLPQRDFDQSDMPDLVFLEVMYVLGPNGIEHPTPAIAILVPSADGLDKEYTTEFSARASVEYVNRTGNDVNILAPAYVNGAACCPDGTEYVHLVWIGDRLVEVERCVRPGRFYYYSDARSCG